MNTNSITIREAVDRGLKTIALPSKIILILSTALCVLLLILSFSWWDFLLLPIGILLSVLHTAWTTPRWKIWAYEHVEDIHQLQRSAELAGLLMIQSHESTGGLIGRNQKNKLRALQSRFLKEPVFVDDPSIPNKTPVPGPNRPLIILKDSGIQVQPGVFFEWDKIYDERVVKVSYSRTNYSTGADTSAGSKDFFRFECPAQRFEMPLSALNTTAWELDLLLYIYRGRFMLKQKGN